MPTNNNEKRSCTIAGIEADMDQPWENKFHDGLKRSLLLTFIGVPLPAILMLSTDNRWISISITYTVLLLLAAISGKRT